MIQEHITVLLSGSQEELLESFKAKLTEGWKVSYVQFYRDIPETQVEPSG